MSIFDIAGVDSTLISRLMVELDDVSTIFDRQLASDFPPVNTLSVHISRYQGKMLRPTLVLISGMAVDESVVDSSHHHRTIGAVTEMIHMATLVHDDVLDESRIRRGGATINALHGNEMAVMLGDYLISNAFHLCSTLGDQSLNLRLGEITNTLCEGEIVQLHNRENLDLDFVGLDKYNLVKNLDFNGNHLISTHPDFIQKWDLKKMVVSKFSIENFNSKKDYLDTHKFSKAIISG